MQERKSGKIALSVFLSLVGLLSIYFVYVRTRAGVWDYDGAIYVQPALFLARSFVYASNSYPAHIYASYICTNGPMQYLMAGLLLAFDAETARVIFSVTAFAVFWYAAYCYSRLGAFLCSALLLNWAIFLDCSTKYWGELPAVIFCLLGLIYTERSLKKNPGTTPLLGPVLFGLAISTKLITVGLVPFLILYATERSNEIRPAPKLKLAALGYAISLLTFVSFYYLAVAQSLLVARLAPAGFVQSALQWTGLLDFVRYHFSIQLSQGRLPIDPRQIFAFNPYLFLFLGAALAAGARRYRSLLLFALGYAVLFLFAHIYERRIFPYLFFLLFLGTIALGSTVTGLWQNNRRRAALAVSALYLASFLFPTLEAWPALRQSMKYTVQARAFLAPQVKYAQRYGKIAEFLPYAEYPVLDNEWSMLPDLSLITQVRFYHRFDPANRDLLQKYPKVYFAFREGEERGHFSSRALCRQVILEENGIVFCEFNRAFPVNARPPATPQRRP